MKVYQIMEYGSFGKRYEWGIYSSKEKAKEFLKINNWEDDEDFRIITREVDVNIKEEKGEEL